MTPKLAQFCDDPKKISTKSSNPQKIFIFLKKPKNIEIQNFEPQKIGRACVCVWKYQSTPPGVWTYLERQLIQIASPGLYQYFYLWLLFQYVCGG